MNKLLESLLVLGAQYGLPFVIDCIKSLKKADITLDDIEALFSNVKPYEAYQIPDVVPTKMAGLGSSGIVGTGFTSVSPK